MIEPNRKKSRGINLLLLSRKQDSNSEQLEEILKNARGKLGCAPCCSGLRLIPWWLDEEMDWVPELGNAVIDNILVATASGEVKTLPELAQGAGG